MYPAPTAVERIGPDWDWIWIDCQHGTIDDHAMLEMVRAAEVVNVAALVRVPSHDAAWIMRALDAGAAGVIVPQVQTVDQARAVAAAAKFPPIGERSYGGRRIIDRRGRGYSDTANEETMVVAQIESPRALEAVGPIAGVAGIDAVLLGPDDMSLCLGLAMTQARSIEQMRGWLEPIVAACESQGKIPAAIGMSAELVELYVTMGFKMIACGADVQFLARGSKQASEAMRQITCGHGGTARKGTSGSVY
jgi:4-hydroxy-2-oxoheptanedioate aldolase